ncbi:hypothetical protein OUZ56_025203 [Daphnia magna]|uniref:Uncharacterized protein n=1 Tax=Daphnia magna TaxID=35525 RepID=A0ABQ9ZK60_9CRUS|nr:hypothetical protein OUZ56_025203 [Daphnia magna]
MQLAINSLALGLSKRIKALRCFRKKYYQYVSVPKEFYHSNVFGNVELFVEDSSANPQMARPVDELPLVRNERNS